MKMSLIFALVLATFHSTAGQSEYDMRTTTWMANATFDLPEREGVYLAFWPMAYEPFTIDLGFAVNGNDLHKSVYNYEAIEKWSYIRITREEMQIPDFEAVKIPQQLQTLRGRRVTVSSRKTISWQMYVDTSEQGEPKSQPLRQDPRSFKILFTVSGIFNGLCALTTLTVSMYFCYRKKMSKYHQEPDTSVTMCKI